MHDSRAQPGQFLRWRGAGRLCANGTRLRAITKRSSSLSCMSARYSAYLFCICIRILCKIKSVEAGARLLHIESLGHVHLAGGDYNASLFPEARKGYSNSRETKEADGAFKNSLSTLSTQSLGGQGTLKEACSHDVARNLLRPLDWTRS